MSDKKSPAIRFPGFTDDWEQRKFGDVGSVAMCKRIFKEQTSEEGDVPFYKIGTFGGTPDAYISRELFEEYKKAYQYPSKGDILISASGSIGRTVEYTGEDEYFQDSNIVWLKHGDDIDNAFLKVLYSVVEWSCEGSTIKRLYNDNFLKTEFMLPYIEEQTKIGEFFCQIDNLITLHQRKCDKLKEYKKGCLQKMFPKDGADVPEVRFPGFTDAWEQRKLGDIATFINGRAYSQEELLSSGKYKVLRVGNFYTNDSWYYSDLELDDKYYAEEGDLLYTWSATFGPHIWHGEKVIYHYHIWKVELSEHLEKQFAVHLLEQDKAAILSDKNGSTMVHITKAGMEGKSVLIPKNVNEQAKIGAYLDEFDTLITLHQRKLETMKKIKKSLLQKMFV